MRALLAATAISMLACHGVSEAGDGHRFRYAFQGSLQLLDPYALNETFTFGQLGNTYEGLVARDRDLAIVPALAERWEVLEPTRWRFHLRRGVRFHDGSPFTADDVLFSAERVRQPGSDFTTRLPADARFEAVDDYTVDVHLTAPQPLLIQEWDSWYMMDRAWAEAHDATLPSRLGGRTTGFAALHSNGTGPFTIREHEPGLRTVFVRHDGWWGEPGHDLAEAVLTPIPVDATRVAALLSGEVDMIDPVPLQDIARVEAHPGTHVLTGPELRTIFLGLDQQSPELASSNLRGRNPLADRRVRAAMAMAIDTRAITARIMRGHATPAALPISPLLFAPAATMPPPAYDPAAARRLLGEAGHGGGFELTLDCPNDRYVKDEAICEAVAGFLAKIGIAVRLDIQPKARFFAKILQGGGYDTDFYLLGYTPASFEAGSVLRNLLNCRDASGQPSPLNIGGYCNPEVDRLTAALATTEGTEERTALAAEAFALARHDVAYIPLHQQALAWGVADGFELVQRADNQLLLAQVRVRQ